MTTYHNIWMILYISLIDLSFIFQRTGDGYSRLRRARLMLRRNCPTTYIEGPFSLWPWSRYSNWDLNLSRVLVHLIAFNLTVGHGLSSGEPVQIDSIDQYVDDIIQHVSLVKEAFPQLPVFPVGFSMVNFHFQSIPYLAQPLIIA